MKYNDFTELLKSKRILLKEVLSYVKMSRPGLSSALDNETIELRKIKLICELLRVSPAIFFEPGNFGNIQNPIIPDKTKVADMEKEITYLKQSLRDKEEIINLLREKDDGYRLDSERQSGYELSKKTK